MKRDLETLRDVLWEHFEDAAERHHHYSNPWDSDNYTPMNFSIQNRQAMGALGQAIADVEREIREQQQTRPVTIDKGNAI